MPEPSIAVVGAAGYVGRELLRQLEASGVQTTAVIRGFRELSVEGTFHDAKALADLGGQRFDVVVNLAYPTSGLPFEQRGLNAAIIDTVRALVTPGGRLIQASTASVFGMTLDRPIAAKRVPALRDMPYVESKIEAEHAFEDDQQNLGLSLDVVRFGNVWGQYSGAWALPMLQRLVTGRPIGVLGTPGRSNATDVENAASYLAFILGNGATARGTRYHHLAEFSSVPWIDWLGPVADLVGVEPVFADPSTLNAPPSTSAEFQQAFTGLRPRTLYRTLAAERAAGSWTRTVIRALPSRAQSKLRSDLVYATAPPVDRLEQIFLSIFAGRQEFRSVVDERWKPQVSQDESLDRVMRWVQQG